MNAWHENSVDRKVICKTHTNLQRIDESTDRGPDRLISSKLLLLSKTFDDRGPDRLISSKLLLLSKTFDQYLLFYLTTSSRFLLIRNQLNKSNDPLHLFCKVFSSTHNSLTQFKREETISLKPYNQEQKIQRIGRRRSLIEELLRRTIQLAKGTPRHPEEDKQKNCNSRWSQDEGGEITKTFGDSNNGWMNKRCACLEGDQLDQSGLEVYKDTEPLSKTFKVLLEEEALAAVSFCSSELLDLQV
ncbi:hypothetical protein YC2023_094827 [Brassica napus]